MDCPRDQTALAAFEIDGLELNTCPSCQGLWFDSDELRRVKDLAEPGLDWMDFEIFRHEERFEVEPHPDKCPRCGRPMARLRYGDTDVRVDACVSCRGVWLDAGELESMLQALQHEASSKPASEYMLQTLKEALHILSSPAHAAEEWRDLRHVFNLLKMRLMVERPALMKAMERAQKSTPF